MSDGIITDTIATQQKTRGDILSLRDAISELCEIVAENSEALKELLAIQQAHDEREERLAVMCEDVTKIANSMASMMEGMHRAIQLLNDHIEHLNMRVSAEETMESMIVKMRGLGVAINGQADKGEAK